MSFFKSNKKVATQSMAQLIEAFTAGAKAIISRENDKVEAEKLARAEREIAHEEAVKAHQKATLESTDAVYESQVEIGKASKFIEKFEI